MCLWVFLHTHIHVSYVQSCNQAAYFPPPDFIQGPSLLILKLSAILMSPFRPHLLSKACWRNLLHSQGNKFAFAGKSSLFLDFSFCWLNETYLPSLDRPILMPSSNSAYYTPVIRKQCWRILLPAWFCFQSLPQAPLCHNYIQLLKTNGVSLQLLCCQAPHTWVFCRA